MTERWKEIRAAFLRAATPSPAETPVRPWHPDEVPALALEVACKRLAELQRELADAERRGAEREREEIKSLLVIEGLGNVATWIESRRRGENIRLRRAQGGGDGS